MENNLKLCLSLYFFFLISMGKQKVKQNKKKQANNNKKKHFWNKVPRWYFYDSSTLPSISLIFFFFNYLSILDSKSFKWEFCLHSLIANYVTHSVHYHKENDKIDDILDLELDINVAIHFTTWFITAIFVLHSAINGLAYTEMAEQLQTGLSLITESRLFCCIAKGQMID